MKDMQTVTSRCLWAALALLFAVVLFLAKNPVVFAAASTYATKGIILASTDEGGEAPDTEQYAEPDPEGEPEAEEPAYEEEQRYEPQEYVPEYEPEADNPGEEGGEGAGEEGDAADEQPLEEPQEGSRE